MKKADNEWREVAIKLYKVLHRTSYYECNHLDHSGGFYHGNNEECPIMKQIKDAFEEYEKLSKNKL